MWKLDVTMVTAELTLAATVPAMAHLKDVGAASLQAAHIAAEDHARRVAELVSATDAAVDLTAPAPPPSDRRPKSLVDKGISAYGVVVGWHGVVSGVPSRLRSCQRSSSHPSPIR